MKEYIAETGGRYTYSDDILNLQELALSMSAVFEMCIRDRPSPKEKSAAG